MPRFVDLPLSTPRLQLRPLRPADAAALFSIDADPLAIEPRNERSAESLERPGFVREGCLRERWVVAGEVSDSALYGLLARDWRSEASGAAR